MPEACLTCSALKGTIPLALSWSHQDNRNHFVLPDGKRIEVKNKAVYWSEHSANPKTTHQINYACIR